MKDLIRFQIQVATGRFTLPVTIVLCLTLWGITGQEWNDVVSLCITAAVGYVMIETNTTFTLIRTRTALPVCIYWSLTAGLTFLHSFSWSNLTPMFFALATYQLFRCYESHSPAVSIFHAFLFIGSGSIVFPPFMILAGIWWASMIPFRAINVKSFLASLVGLVAPYWLLFGYAFWFDRMPLFLAPWQEMTHWYPTDYNVLTPTEIASWAIITFLQFISSIHYGWISHMDRTRARICHSFLIYAGWGTALLCVLQPVHLHEWLPIQCICTSFLCGHLFTLTRNHFSGIFFLVTFIAIFLLMLHSVWMQFFNF